MIQAVACCPSTGGGLTAEFFSSHLPVSLVAGFAQICMASADLRSGRAAQRRFQKKRDVESAVNDLNFLVYSR